MSDIVGSYVFLPSTQGLQQWEIVEHKEGDDYVVVHGGRQQLASIPEGAEIVQPIDMIDQEVIDIMEGTESPDAPMP